MNNFLVSYSAQIYLHQGLRIFKLYVCTKFYDYKNINKLYIFILLMVVFIVIDIYFKVVFY
jgi:hypothetical protein